MDVETKSLNRDFRAICERLDKIIEILEPKTVGDVGMATDPSGKPYKPNIQGATGSISSKLKEMKGD